MNSPDESLPTVDRFIHILARCGLIERDVLRRLVDGAPSAVRRDSQKLADHLVANEALTQFQARKLLQGAWHGLVLGPFQILAPLGRGGMGAVYLARNVCAGKGKRPPAGDEPPTAADMPALVALKVLPPKRAKQEERTLARFLREMDLCRRVSHPHITRTFIVGEIEGVYYIAMEYIRGASLSELVKSGGPLPAERAARFFSEVADGLALAHAKGLIHRDLKPSNLMATPNGHAKILDLGLAMMLDEELPTDKMIVGGQGYVVGTMDYISPEQVDDPSQVDGRADLYSLGCALFFTLTGQPPFPGGTSRQKMQRHRDEYAEPIPDLNPTVPVEFARIVEKLMEKKPGKRYRSAAQVRDTLLPWAAGDPEKPLDVDPMLSETEAVHQLEMKLNAEPSLWWEAVPVITFDATAKYGAPVERGSPSETGADPPAELVDGETPTHNNPLIVLGIIAGLILFVAILELLRR